MPSIGQHAWTKEEVAAIKAVYATDHGRFALDAIVYRLGLLQAASMASDPYLTAFNEGRRYVAGAIHNACTVPLSHLVPDRTDEHRNRPLTATERFAKPSRRHPTRPE